MKRNRRTKELTLGGRRIKNVKYGNTHQQNEQIHCGNSNKGTTKDSQIKLSK